MGGLSPVARAYARLGRYIALIGLHPPPQQTPHERRAQILTQLPQAEPPVNAITALYTAERYGQPESEAQQVAGEVAEQAWPDVRGSIVRRWLGRVFLPWRGRRESQGWGGLIRRCLTRDSNKPPVQGACVWVLWSAACASVR